MLVPNDQLRDLDERAKEGDVVPFRRGSLLFTHPNAVREILITHDAAFQKSPALRKASWTLGNGLLTADGALHKKQRPIMQPALHTKRLAGYAGIMAKHSLEVAASWKDGQTLDAHAEMTALTLHIVAEALFGTALGPEVDAVSEAMDYNVQAFRKLVRKWGPLLAILPTPQNFRYLLARRKLISVLRRFVVERRTSGVQRDDLLGRLLAARTPEGKPAMSQKQLIDECVTLFAAGHETTANAMTFTLVLLAQHPEERAKLRAEVEAVMPSPEYELTIDDVDRLPYTRQIIAESMRLYPPAWIQGRQAMADVTIDGQPIKRGRVVFIAQWLTHRDPRWWPNPERFDPSRFDETHPAPAADGSPRPRWAYYPFGGGSRSCIGEAFAWAELTIALATLVRRWRFQISPDAGSVELEPGITLRPAGAVRLRVQN